MRALGGPRVRGLGMALWQPTSTHRWHPRLIEAALALHDNRLDVAERLLKPHLKEDPFDVRAIRMLAELAARIGRLKRCREPASPGARDRARLHRRAGQSGAGAGPNWAGRPRRWRCSTSCSRRSRTQVGHLNLKAATLGRLGDFDEAIELYEQVLAQAPNQPRVWIELWPYAEDGRPAGRGHRRLPQGDRAQADARRGLVEPGQPQDRQVRRSRHRRDAGGAGKRRPARTTTGSTSISRWARRCTMPAAATRRSPIMRPAMRCAGSITRFAAGDITQLVDRSIELFTAEACSDGRAAARRPTRSSSSACRAPDRRWSSRSSRRTARSKARPSCPTCRPWRDRDGAIPAGSLKLSADERRDAGEDYLQAGLGPAADRAAILHRQAAQQLDVRAVHPPDPAERQDHRRAAPSARLLLVQLPPAFRPRPGLHLRPRRPWPLLCRLCPADGACRRGAARAASIA